MIKPYVRRDRVVALLGLCALGGILAIGCGGKGGGSSASSATILKTAPEAVAFINGQNVDYTATVETKGERTVVWTTNDGSQIESLFQTLAYKGDPTQGVRAEFDSSGQPILAVQHSNGAFMTVDWSATRAIFKMYRSNGLYVGGSVVTQSGSTFDITSLPAPADTGFFSGTLNGLTAGVVSFSYGSGGASALNAQRTKAAQSRIQRITRATDSTTLGTLTALQGATSGDGQTTFAKSLIDSLAADSSASLSKKIVSVAVGSSNVKNLYLNGGADLLRAAASSRRVAARAAAILGKASNGTDVVASHTLSIATTAPPGASVATDYDLQEPLSTGDGSAVTGIVAAREFGAIPLKGVIDGQQHLTIKGTSSTGQSISLEGTVANGAISGGTYTLSGAKAQARDANDTWGASAVQPGQCQEQQNSGNQGIFTNIYDLGTTCGNFTFFREAYQIPDQFQVYYEGHLLLDTGSVSGNDTQTVSFSGSSTQITVVVTAALNGTAWNYTVGCPDSTRGCVR